MRKRAVAAITALLLFLEGGILQIPLVCAMEASQGEMHEMKEPHKGEEKMDEQNEEGMKEAGKSENETTEGIEEESDGEEEKRSEIVFPEFWLSAVVNDAGNTVTDTDGIYYFRKSMTIRIQMEDVSGGRNEGRIEAGAEDKEDPDGRFVIKRNGIELTEEGEGFEDVLEEEGEYHYDIVYITEDDEVAGEHMLTVKGRKVTDTPFIQNSYALEPVKVHEKAYFKEDPQIRVCAGASAGIVLAEYRVGDGAYQVWKDFQSEDTCYMYGEHSSLEEDPGETDVFAELLTSMADGSYRYTFRITDVLGGTASADVEFVIDKTAPDRRIFVSYASDGTNPQTGSQTGLMDFVRSVTDRLFGRTEICFDLYVRDGRSTGEGQDTASGIDTEDLCDQILTSGGKAAVQKIQVIEEGVSFVYEGITYSGYTQIRGCVKLPSEYEESMSDHLQIGRLKDRAGNRMNATDVENLTGMTVLYIDSKSPLLSVDYGAGMIDDEKKAVFYPNGTALPIVLKEENYQDQIGENGDPVKPSVTIQDHGGCGASADEWELSGERDDQVCTRLVFPEMSGMGEVRYDFTVEYQDGAGNFLKPDRMVPGDAEQGVYTGYTIVVDNRPPELTSFSVHGNVTGQCSGADVYQNTEGEDIRFSFSIDDHETYWDPEAVRLIVWNTDTQNTAAEISGGSLQWEDDGRSHQAEYAYDGEEGMTAAAYQIMLSYEDCAGNRLTGRGDLKALVEEGVYTSRRFILDHEAPGFCIAFNEAVRLVKASDPDPLLDRRDCMPQTGYTAYYDDTVEVFFSLRESCTEPLYQDQEFTGLRDFELVVSEKDTGDFQPDICWNRTGDLYEGRFSLAEEGQYTISVRYRDMAGNVMEAEEVHGSRREPDIPGDGSYESVLLILDRTPPVYQVSCVDMDYHEKQEKAVLEVNGCRFFSEPIYLKLEVKDENLRFHELLQELQRIHAADREGNEILNNSAGMFLEDHDGAQLAEEGVTWYLPLLTEAVYEIPVSCMDLAGNRTEQIMEQICVDQTDPGLELSWSVEKSGFLDAVRYRDIRYLFADGRMTIKAAARDLVSGIRSIEYRMEEEDGRTIGKMMDCMPTDSEDYEITVPTDSSDFKGIITATVRDWSGNSTVQTCGYIAEGEERHSQEGEIRILTETSPSRTVAGVDYYNTDIRLKLVVQDTCSGLRDISCRGGKTVDHHRAFSEKDGIVYKYQEDLVLNAVANNENGVSVRADYQDHTGHTGTAEQSYHIDVTAPVIEVKYDNDQRSDQGLYAQPRRAVVTIRERNFDPADVEFQITNTDGILPSIGEWQATGTGDDTLHVCCVDFLADGDYTFTLGFTDLAGNRSEYGRVDEFTIDQTKPEVSVSFDHESGDQEYYAQSRVAVIDVLEHNFDASLIQIIVKEQDDMTALNSSWRREGDHNVTRVRFDRDGDYSLSIMGTDQAGNQMKEYETEHFVIDQTAPVLEISGLKDRSANKGTVTPVIRCLDANYQKGAMKIQLRGCRNGLLDLKGTCTEKEGEELFLAEDFAYIPEMDDLYWLAVSVSDLAGNVSQKEICFSVNRFGSVYTLEDKTELLAGSRGVYYTNTEQDIIVTETNVDTLEFLEISCNRNGKLLTLSQGEDYYVQESGTDESWKQYIYTIPGRNFTEEGTYILMLYSEDRAENTSDNQTKGKKIEFVIDKTAPSVLLSGVEDGKQYRENSRRFTLDVQDNVRISEVKVNINGVVSTYYASELLERDGRLTLAAGSADHWQSICITASDAAGNTKELEELKFLLTSNLWIQFLTDRTLLCCTICGLLLVWAGGWWLFFRRRQSGKCKRCG